MLKLQTAPIGVHFATIKRDGWKKQPSNTGQIKAPEKKHGVMMLWLIVKVVAAIKAFITMLHGCDGLWRTIRPPSHIAPRCLQKYQHLCNLAPIFPCSTLLRSTVCRVSEFVLTQPALFRLFLLMLFSMCTVRFYS